MIILTNIEKLRDEKELLKKQMAKYIGVVESVYSEWENEKLSIPTRRIYQLAEFFEVNIDYMLGLTNTRIKMKTNKEIDIKLVSIRLKEVRKSLNLTMRGLAKIFNTSSSAISNYENEKFLILSPFLIELSKFSKYSIDWILGRSTNKFLK